MTAATYKLVSPDRRLPALYACQGARPHLYHVYELDVREAPHAPSAQGKGHKYTATIVEIDLADPSANDALKRGGLELSLTGRLTTIGGAHVVAEYGDHDYARRLIKALWDYGCYSFVDTLSGNSLAKLAQDARATIARDREVGS